MKIWIVKIQKKTAILNSNLQKKYKDNIIDLFKYLQKFSKYIETAKSRKKQKKKKQ